MGLGATSHLYNSAPVTVHPLHRNAGMRSLLTSIQRRQRAGKRKREIFKQISIRNLSCYYLFLATSFEHGQLHHFFSLECVRDVLLELNVVLRWLAELGEAWQVQIVFQLATCLDDAEMA